MSQHTAGSPTMPDRPPLPRPRAILFDLDDTLTLRQAALARFATRFAQDFAAHLTPLEPDALLATMVAFDAQGYRPRTEFAALLRQVLPWARPPDESALLAHWQTVFPQCCSAPAGTRRVLDQLRARGIALGIITNGKEAVQRAKIGALGIRHCFATIVISDAVGVRKPDPRIFQLALAKLVVAPGEAWFVGDHPRNDMWGAANAGMTGVWLPGQFTWPDDLAPPAARITRLADLLDLCAPSPLDHLPPP